MKELISAVGLAKVRVDAGFSRVGRRLSPEDAADGVLMTLAARAISVGNAVMLLCREGHANEALPLLRALAEFALAMRWISAADPAERARTVGAALAARWEDLWPAARARESAADFGVAGRAVETAFASTPAFLRANAQGLPWSHVYAQEVAARTPEEVLSAAGAWLALALEALDRRWPGEFPGAAEIRDRAQISRGQ